jgi:hypothetical protein
MKKIAVSDKRPILFSGPMVRAILEGRKTMTRRVVKVPEWKEKPDSYTCKVATVYKYFDVSGHNWITWDSDGIGGWNDKADTIEQAKINSYIAAIRQGFASCPHGKVGDRLWVRETFREVGSCQQADGKLRGPLSQDQILYRANDPCESGSWRPSIFMPRWASRTTLEITNVRVEQLQDITEEDALNEGIIKNSDGFFFGKRFSGSTSFFTAAASYCKRSIPYALGIHKRPRLMGRESVGMG